MKTIITIERQYGSGGAAIGKLLSERLGIPYYNDELLKLASQESGISEELFHKHDETPTGSVIYSLFMGTYPVGDDGRVYPDLPLNHKLFLAQFETIKKLAEKGPCVLIGRCSNYVLKDNPNTINVFFFADFEDRKKRIKDIYDYDEKKIEDIIKRTDKRRASYNSYYTDQKWGDAKNYDLCINTSKLSHDGAVDVILKFIEANGLKNS